MAKRPEWLDSAVFYEIYPQSFKDLFTLTAHWGHASADDWHGHTSGGRLRRLFLYFANLPVFDNDNPRKNP